MKPKEIPDNFIVQINNITELGELCTILRDNGWRQRDGILYRETGCVMTIDRKNRMAIFRTRRDEEDIEILNLDEFKERYSIPPNSGELKSQSTENKPQPKFKVGDRVMIDGVINLALNHHVGSILELPNIDHPSRYKVGLADGYTFLEEFYLNPYPEPEPETTEDMETKEEKSENPVNFCEMLHEGDTVYSLIDGEGEVGSLDEDGFHLNGWYFRNNGTIAGSGPSTANCLIYPSRALYEQYPLDPQKAWQEWQERYILSIALVGNDLESESAVMFFRIPADRDKCIEEIKGIIDKYSEK